MLDSGPVISSSTRIWTRELRSRSSSGALKTTLGSLSPTPTTTGSPRRKINPTVRRRSPSQRDLKILTKQMNQRRGRSRVLRPLRHMPSQSGRSWFKRMKMLRQAANQNANGSFFPLSLSPQMPWEDGICQNWNLSESIFCHFLKKLETVRMGHSHFI